MGKAIVIKAEARSGTGSSEAGRLRRSGWLPGSVSKPGSESLSVQLKAHDFGMMLHRHTSENLIIDLDVGEAEVKKVLLREVQHHPVTGKLLHADFVEISMSEKMKVDATIELTGIPVGVTEGGGVLEHLLREVEVECLPGDLPEQIDVDVVSLKIGDTLFVRDIKIGAELTVVTDGGIAIASVAAPKTEEEVVSTEEELAEGAESAVGGEEKAADGEGAAVKAEGGKGAKKEGDK